MKKLSILAALALVAATAMPSMAQTHRTQSREYHQEKRIVRSLVNGQLTPRELRRIEQQQRRIDHSQARAARDGVVTPAEQRRLERQQDRASRSIYRKTHNGRTVY